MRNFPGRDIAPRAQQATGCLAAQELSDPWRNDDGKQAHPEGNSSDSGEPDPGPYWRRMHRDWRFWVGALLMAGALAVYVLSGDLAWVPIAHR